MVTEGSAQGHHCGIPKVPKMVKNTRLWALTGLDYGFISTLGH